MSEQQGLSWKGLDRGSACLLPTLESHPLVQLRPSLASASTSVTLRQAAGLWGIGRVLQACLCPMAQPGQEAKWTASLDWAPQMSQGVPGSLPAARP